MQPVTSYPGFGDLTNESPQYNKIKIIKEVSAGVIFVVGVAAIAALATSSLGIGLIAGAGAVGVVVISKIAIEAFRKYHAHSYEVELQIDKLNREDNQGSIPKLGEYSQASVKVINHTQESFEWKKTLIESAQSSIELSANYAGDEEFREVLGLIEQRMKACPGLKAHLILSEDLLTKQDINLLKRLAIDYPDRFNYLITGRVYQLHPYLLAEENHVKLLVVDQKYFAMGSSGITKQMVREDVPKNDKNQGSLAARFLSPAFKEMDLIGKGDVAATMRHQFFDLYSIWEYRANKVKKDRFFSVEESTKGSCQKFDEGQGFKTCPIKFIVCSPAHRSKNPISEEIAKLIRQAQNHIKIGNLYFNPDKEVRKALKEKKQGGVETVCYFNGSEENVHIATPFLVLPSRANYDLLTTANEYKAEKRIYHKKVMTIDTTHTAIGSYNHSVQSRECAYECLCVIEDSEITSFVKEKLEEDAKVSREFTGKDLASKYKWSFIPGHLLAEAFGSLCA